jgi:hypothetical protein
MPANSNLLSSYSSYRLSHNNNTKFMDKNKVAENTFPEIPLINSDVVHDTDHLHANDDAENEIFNVGGIKMYSEIDVKSLKILLDEYASNKPSPLDEKQYLQLKKQFEFVIRMNQEKMQTLSRKVPSTHSSEFAFPNWEFIGNTVFPAFRPYNNIFCVPKSETEYWSKYDYRKPKLLNLFQLRNQIDVYHNRKTRLGTCGIVSIEVVFPKDHFKVGPSDPDLGRMVLIYHRFRKYEFQVISLPWALLQDVIQCLVRSNHMLAKDFIEDRKLSKIRKIEDEILELQDDRESCIEMLDEGVSHDNSEQENRIAQIEKRLSSLTVMYQEVNDQTNSYRDALDFSRGIQNILASNDGVPLKRIE